MTAVGSREKVLVVFGTRPEVIKLGPVVRAFRSDPSFAVETLATAQHREMLDEMLGVFQIEPDHDLDIMSPNQTLLDVTVKCLTGVSQVLRTTRPDIVLVQGDTTTVMSTAMACYYEKVAVGHVEAGLRTADKYSPFPEEMNRRIAGTMADIHFAPTESAKENLRREGVPERSILVTGNTVVDAVLEIADRPESSAGRTEITDFQARFAKPILVTVHRRESFGEPLEEICRAILDLIEVEEQIGIVLPVHPNPNVSQTVRALLGGNDRILLVEPLSYVEFVHAMKRSYLILSDSGGVQEEAPSLGKPVLVLRPKTERPEGIEAGVARLVGTDRRRIVDEATRLVESADAYDRMVKGVNPYGDGHASERIVEAVARFLHGS